VGVDVLGAGGLVDGQRVIAEGFSLGAYIGYCGLAFAAAVAHYDLAPRGNAFEAVYSFFSLGAPGNSFPKVRHRLAKSVTRKYAKLCSVGILEGRECHRNAGVMSATTMNAKNITIVACVDFI
jgi:hypothetical protein